MTEGIFKKKMGRPIKRISFDGIGGRRQLEEIRQTKSIARNILRKIYKYDPYYPSLKEFINLEDWEKYVNELETYLAETEYHYREEQNKLREKGHRNRLRYLIRSWLRRQDTELKYKYNPKNIKDSEGKDPYDKFDPVYEHFYKTTSNIIEGTMEVSNEKRKENFKQLHDKVQKGIIKIREGYDKNR